MPAVFTALEEAWDTAALPADIGSGILCSSSGLCETFRVEAGTDQHQNRRGQTDEAVQYEQNLRPQASSTEPE
jgi:hypothetical protein